MTITYAPPTVETVRDMNGCEIVVGADVRAYRANGSESYTVTGTVVAIDNCELCDDNNDLLPCNYDHCIGVRVDDDPAGTVFYFDHDAVICTSALRDDGRIIRVGDIVRSDYDPTEIGRVYDVSLNRLFVEPFRGVAGMRGVFVIVNPDVAIVVG